MEFDDLSPFEQFFFHEFMPNMAVMQSRVMANQFIMVELVRDIARGQPDPKRYIRDVYERVIARAEKGPIGEGMADANFKEGVEAVLMKAANSI